MLFTITFPILTWAALAKGRIGTRSTRSRWTRTLMVVAVSLENVRVRWPRRSGRSLALNLENGLSKVLIQGNLFLSGNGRFQLFT